jgi:hypothetical protein
MKSKEDIAKDIYFWQTTDNDNWSALLFSLWMKADPWNRARLKRAFPDEIGTLQEWYDSESADVFFMKYVPELLGRQRASE